MSNFLFITELYPSGHSGTTYRTRHVLKSLLSAGHSMDVCCFINKTPQRNPLKHKNIRFFSIHKEILKPNPFVRLVMALNTFPNIFPFRLHPYYSYDMRRKITRLLKKNSYKAIFLDGFSTLLYIDLFPSENVIYLEDEDIPILMKERARQSISPLVKWIFFIEFILSKRFEQKRLTHVSQIWTISHQKDHRFRKEYSLEVRKMPTVITFKNNSFSKQSKHIVFVGLLSWSENEHALVWFLKHCWDDIHQKYPDTIFYIVGQKATRKLRMLVDGKRNVKLVGFVKNLNEVYQKCAVAVSPVLVNVGIKMKILNYLSYGLPVVATNSSVKGLVDTEGVVKSNESNFAKKVKILLSDGKLRNELSKKAEKNIKLNYSRDKLLTFVNQYV